MRGQSASKEEERGDNRVDEETLENCSVDGSEERTVEERVGGREGFQVVAGDDRVRCRSEGDGGTSRGERK